MDFWWFVGSIQVGLFCSTLIRIISQYSRETQIGAELTIVYNHFLSVNSDQYSVQKIIQFLSKVNKI